MKKIINGKVYDTNTATRVAQWEYMEDAGNFGYSSEELYRKKTGEFFIHGKGGPMTKYAESTGENNWRGGEKIIPLSYEAAQKWAEEHMDGDEYEKIFGAVAEDASRVTVTFSLPAGLVEQLKRKASKRGIGQSDLLEELIRSGLNG